MVIKQYGFVLGGDQSKMYGELAQIAHGDLFTWTVGSLHYRHVNTQSQWFT